MRSTRKWVGAIAVAALATAAPIALHASAQADTQPTANTLATQAGAAQALAAQAGAAQAGVAQANAAQANAAQANTAQADAAENGAAQAQNPADQATRTTAKKQSTKSTAKTSAAGADLDDPRKKEIAMELVSSAENSSLDWKAQYSYIEDIGDGRGYTAGIIGFCSGTGDMLDLVTLYNQRKPNNPLSKFLPALKKVDGTDSHAGLGNGFTSAWKTAAKDSAFQTAQNDERDRVYFDPAVSQRLGELRRHPQDGDEERENPRAGRQRGHLSQRVPGRAQGRDDHRGGAHGHQPSRHRAARLPQGRQPRPEHAAQVEGLRGPVHDQLS
jgi:glycosyl hydrolase family 46